MANLIRSAKSGNEWTENELAAYNIHVHEQSLKDFFDVEVVEDLPEVQPSLGTFVTTEDRIDAPDDDTYRLLHFLDFAHIPKGAAPLHFNDILLLVQEDKRLDNNADPEPQVIAEAIAAFQRNNFTRKRELHLPVLDQMVFPAITMYGSFPTFYKITVSAALNDAVKTGVFPVAATTVYRHIPRLPRRNSNGMKNLANRSILLRYLEAFKRFVV
ncbi:hypothetical protein C8J57DRAFT_1237595 [Mycena rebaudengoi]|nr:hypothetical protein C8J57DRAFT_1237595 [Mycena rebaudengoi]